MKKLFSAALVAAFLTFPTSCGISDFMPSKPEPDEVKQEYTPITGDSEITEDAALKWAKAHNCSALFADLAQYYWKYGSLTGIRPEVMYAQAALETAYGHFGGRVLPEMNNFAGIKRVDAVGDATEEHETFPTRDDGVRAHYNHMCAYVGFDTVGIPHDRYYLVLSTDWAGTVKYVEELGGKWCPDTEYGNKIVNTFLADMYSYK